MNIFFDVDYTILGADGTVRPGTREVFEQLRADGHRLFIWSGNGIRWREMRSAKLDHLIIGCYEKPLSNHYRGLLALGVAAYPDFAVDDYPQIAEAFGGYWITAYTFERYRDNEMERVYRVISDVASTGASTDARYRPRPSPSSV